MFTIGEYIALDAALEERGDGLRHMEFVLTAPGVHTYQIGGKLVRVLKDPADFFGDSYLMSARGVPITDEHPRDGVIKPSQNADQVVGIADSTPAVARDGLVYHGATLHNQNAISKVANKQTKAVSAGFWRDLEENSGVWTDSKGTKHSYDAVSRNPRINHIALTSHPRVPEARILLDSADVAIWVPDDDMTNDDIKQFIQQLAQDSKGSASIAENALREALDSRATEIQGLREQLAEARGKVTALEKRVSESPSMDSMRDAMQAQLKLAAAISKATKLDLDSLCELDSAAAMYRVGLKSLGLEFGEDAEEAELRGAWSVASQRSDSPNSARQQLMAADSGRKTGGAKDAIAALYEKQRRISLGMEN